MDGTPLSIHIFVTNKPSVSAKGANPANAAGDAAGAASNEGDVPGFGDMLASQLKQIGKSAKGQGKDIAIVGEEGKLCKDPKNAKQTDASSTDPSVLQANFVALSTIDPTHGKHDLKSPDGEVCCKIKGDAKGSIQAGIGKLSPDGKDMTKPAEFAVDGKGLPHTSARKEETLLEVKVKTDAGLKQATELIRPDASSSMSNNAALHPEGLSSVRPETVAAPASNQGPNPAQNVSIDVRVGAAGWDSAFSQKVTWMASQNHQIAELHLNPPNLGPVEVRITMNGDQTSAQFMSPHASVRDAIESALPKLREMLADSGLSLGNVNVSSQSFAQHHNEQHHRPTRSWGHGSFGSIEGPMIHGVSSMPLGKNGLVDTFA